MNPFKARLFGRLMLYFAAVTLIPIIITGIVSGLTPGLLVAVGALSLVLGLLLAALFTLDIVRPIRRATETAQRIARRDLTAELNSGRKDELGDLEEAFSEMAAGMHETFLQLRQTFLAAGTSTQGILTIAKEQSMWISEQSSSLLEISTTMEELNGSASMVHQRADFLNKQAQDTLQRTKEGQDSLDTASRSMEEIRAKVKEIGQRIMSLSEQAQAIDQIITSVSDIAEKTDILAINAAIEAVKAGEYGKGFGVVAVEIRKLADQSKKASAKIVSRVREIQAATNNTVMAAEEGEKSVDRGVRQISQAGDIAIGAMKTFQESANLANEIRLASREQSVATGQVAEGTQVISRSVQKMETSFKETIKAVHSLSDQAMEVERLLASYKL